MSRRQTAWAFDRRLTGSKSDASEQNRASDDFGEGARCLGSPKGSPNSAVISASERDLDYVRPRKHSADGVFGLQ